MTPVTPSSVCDMQGESAPIHHLNTIRSRLDRIHKSCQSFGPKQAVGEMIDVMFYMPEWSWLAAALAERTQQEAHSPADAVDQRARFEQFMRKSRTDKGVKGREKLLQRMEGGDYASDHAQRHWWTWQSALGLTRHSKDALTTRPSTEAVSPIQPDYFVQHLGGSYSLADPQPLLSNRKAPVLTSDESKLELLTVVQAMLPLMRSLSEAGLCRETLAAAERAIEQNTEANQAQQGRGQA